MRIIILFRPESEHARQVEEYIADFQRFHPGETLETHNVDTVEGSQLVQLYGVMEYPTIIAAASDGTMQQMWSGADKLPLMNDLAYYAQQ
jgi:hypothetical protein